MHARARVVQEALGVPYLTLLVASIGGLLCGADLLWWDRNVSALRGAAGGSEQRRLLRK